MYHPFYKIYFKRIKSNFEKSENFVVNCLDFFEIMDSPITGQKGNKEFLAHFGIL